ncbi:MAG: acetoacetate--CoA ligase [Chloroflexota bacterium]
MEPKAITEGTLLWQPPAAVEEKANLTCYLRWLKNRYGLVFPSYYELWAWSVTELEQFWASLWDFFEIKASKPYARVLGQRQMPGAEWFVGAELNYAETVFSHITGERPALLYQSEAGPLAEMSWAELYRQTAAVAHFLKELGVRRGDRVVAYLPNIPETVIAFLACASLGAIWSSCSPDFGSRSVLDRFKQIEPKVLLATDRYTWNGKVQDRREVLAELQAALPTLKKTILVPHRADQVQAGGLKETVLWAQAVSMAGPGLRLDFEQTPFDHPLWVLYSSGTTGLPKPIVHGQGGILLEHLKSLLFHFDLKPADRLFWFTNTGWMMWNLLIGGLLTGATIVLYNGSPSYPDLNVLWQLAGAAGITYFGASAAYITACIKAGIAPGRHHDLSRLRAVGSTGSPLSVSGFQWVYQNVHRDIQLASISGGTDVCNAFVGGCPLLPVYAGEIQCRYLGARVEAFDEAGASVVDQVGELVLTEPIPSMPLFFWNDADHRRYRQSYFEMFPGVWRHGDWIKINQRGGCIIYGRSDATIKRRGLRLGTSEIYQVVEGMAEVIDSLVIDLEALDRPSYMALFVVPAEGFTLDASLKKKITEKIRQDISPYYVPDEIYAIKQVPRTLSGTKMEVPVRRILMGYPLEKAANPGAMSHPESIQFFVELAQELAKRLQEEVI